MIGSPFIPMLKVGQNVVPVVDVTSVASEELRIQEDDTVSSAPVTIPIYKVPDNEVWHIENIYARQDSGTWTMDGFGFYDKADTWFWIVKYSTAVTAAHLDLKNMLTLKAGETFHVSIATHSVNGTLETYIIGTKE